MRLAKVNNGQKGILQSHTASLHLLADWNARRRFEGLGPQGRICILGEIEYWTDKALWPKHKLPVCRYDQGVLGYSNHSRNQLMMKLCVPEKAHIFSEHIDTKISISPKMKIRPCGAKPLICSLMRSFENIVFKTTK